MHLSGINVRFLGLLRQVVKTPHIKTLLLVEMLARGFKAELLKKLRAVVKQVSTSKIQKEENASTNPIAVCSRGSVSFEYSGFAK